MSLPSNPISQTAGQACTQDLFRTHDNLVDVWLEHRQRLRKMVQLRIDPRLRRRLDASDVLQEAYLDVAQRIPEYRRQDQGYPFFLWLRSLTLQRLMILHRQHLGTKMRDVRRELAGSAFLSAPATSDSLAEQLLGRFTSPSQAFERAERKAVLQEVLDRMAPLDREILALRYFEGLTNAEASVVLQVELVTVRKRHIRALDRLGSALGTIR